MATYILRNEVSDGARELALTLGGRKIRQFRQREGFYFKRGEQRVAVQFRPNDVIVCWGEALATLPAGTRVLNGGPIRNKFTDAQTLRQAGVPTIEVARTEPQVVPAPPLIDPAAVAWATLRESIYDFPVEFRRNPAMTEGVTQLRLQAEALRLALQAPVPVAPPQNLGVWLPRLNNHVGGNDLLNRPTRADFFAKKIELVREFRIHSFLGRSIRAGQKVEREGMTSHPWIRSFDAGWKILYDGVTARQNHRELAHSACRALNLDFAAVDIGEKTDGSLVVLECNRAPGLSDGTVARYAGAIQRYIQGELD